MLNPCFRFMMCSTRIKCFSLTSALRRAGSRVSSCHLGRGSHSLPLDLRCLQMRKQHGEELMKWCLVRVSAARDATYTWLVWTLTLICGTNNTPLLWKHYKSGCYNSSGGSHSLPLFGRPFQSFNVINNTSLLQKHYESGCYNPDQSIRDATKTLRPARIKPKISSLAHSFFTTPTMQHM